MSRSTACAGCGEPLGSEAHLYVHADATGGPTGVFHLASDCYPKARAARLGCAPVGGESQGRGIAAGQPTRAPATNLEAPGA